MAHSSRLALLPGYDTAPDIYETTAPSLTTSPPSRPLSVSSTSSISSDDNGISHRRILPGTARERFTREGRGRDVRGGEFGDGVGGGKKGWKFGRRRAEDEGLEERVARLRREVEECRMLAEREKTSGDQNEGIDEEMEALREVLEGLDVRGTNANGRDARKSVVRASTNGDEDGEPENEQTEPTGIAGFDARLSALERSLGPLGVEGGLPSGDSSATAPLLPSVQMLDQQLSALMTATSLESLEASSTRIRKLREEAEAFTASQYTTDSSATTNGMSKTPSSASNTSPDLAKLNALYGLLPTLQSLSPTVPAVVERLRSLRTLHGGAANAAAELEALERQQDEFDTELKAWREGLERVEEAVREADEANGRNGKVVQGWVKDLEGRLEKVA
nr:hypothetical protein B0A51_04958 [Rachicladosporium sp. CCFEE 5018]